MQLVINGLAQGSIIAIAAVGITLIFRISRFANAAFGDLMTVGAYITLGIVSFTHLPLLIDAVIGVVLTGLAGGLLYLIVFRRLEGNTFTLFAASIGCALMLRAVVQYTSGTQIRVYGVGNANAVTIGGVRFTDGTLITFGVCACVGILLYAFFNSTLAGRRIRATADDPVLAKVTGIEVRKVTVAVWVVSSAVAAIGGVLLGITGALSPEMGWNFLISAFAAAILGGLGSTSAAIAGGLLIGLAQQAAVLVVPVAYKPAVAFAVMVLVLLMRPTGLFAAKARA